MPEKPCFIPVKINGVTKLRLPADVQLTVVIYGVPVELDNLEEVEFWVKYDKEKS